MISTIETTVPPVVASSREETRTDREHLTTGQDPGVTRIRTGDQETTTLTGDRVIRAGDRVTRAGDRVIRAGDRETRAGDRETRDMVIRAGDRETRDMMIRA